MITIKKPFLLKEVKWTSETVELPQSAKAIADMITDAVVCSHPNLINKFMKNTSPKATYFKLPKNKISTPCPVSKKNQSKKRKGKKNTINLKLST